MRVIILIHIHGYFVHKFAVYSFSIDEEIWKLGVVNGFEKINYIYYFMLGLVVVLLDKKKIYLIYGLDDF